MSRVNMLVAMLLALCAVLSWGRTSIAQDAPKAGKKEKVLLIQNLTVEQKSKIAGVATAAQQQIMQLLTPDQQQQVKDQVAFAKRSTSEVIDSQAALVNLTDEQKTKLAELQADAKAKALAVRNDANLAAADKRKQLSAIWGDTNKAFTKLLTREQQATLKEHAAKARANAGMDAAMNRVSLTDEQKTKIDAIRMDGKTKIDAINADANLDKTEKRKQASAVSKDTDKQVLAVLTPEQLDLYNTALGKKRVKKFAEVLPTLNLTADQQTKIKAITGKATKDIRQLLTAEQQTAFDQLGDQQDTAIQQVIDQNAAEEV